MAEEPDSFRATLQAVMFNDRLNVSELLAVKKYGKRRVNKEVRLFKARVRFDPDLNRRLAEEVDPYEWVITSNAALRGGAIDG